MLILKVCDEANISKKDAEKALNAITKVITEAVASGDKIQLVGFGTFEARDRKERQGKNPRTGEVINIPAATVPAFKAGSAFKEAVNK
jgi:DNA-binding protein HU-beta